MIDSNTLIVPHPKAWTIAWSTKWLNEHPIIRDDDISLIKNMITECIRAAERVGEEQAQEESELLRGGANWVGKYQMLWLIHAIVDHDEIRRAFHTCHNAPCGHMAVKNRNLAETRAASFWQLIANKWNDLLFLPIMEVLPNVYLDFSQQIAVAFESLSHMQSASVEKVEERWQSMNLHLNSVINNWVHSGQGDGGFTCDDDLSGEEED